MTRPVVLVTGASKGIGRATALHAAAAGWDVAVGYRSDRAAAEDVAQACLDAGAQAVVAPVVSALRRVDEMTAEQVAEVLRVNVVGTLLCAGAAVRRMSQRYGGHGGVIVTVSSRAAVRGGAGEYVDYAASKAAVDAITVGLGPEVLAWREIVDRV